MGPIARPLLLTPKRQAYAWGDEAFIPELLGEAPTGEPCAEAWFGAHPSAPAIVSVEERTVALDQLLADDGPRLLGERTHREFGGLPYLLKLLAAARPLSIQVHPNLAQARAGFAQEEAAGIPRDAPHRNYRDANHKPELIVALTRFSALCGFRPLAEIAGALERIPEIRTLLPPFTPTATGLRQLLEAYFAVSADDVARGWKAALARLRGEGENVDDEQPERRRWLFRADEEFSSEGTPDRGLLFLFLLRIVELEPGQALYLGAGIPHAYLAGAGVELMANSDNVLRAGLTPKHVDPTELLRVVEFAAPAPTVLEPEWDEDRRVGRYRTPATEFALERIDLGATPFDDVADGPQTLLSLATEATARASVVSDAGTVELRRGHACFLPDQLRYSIHGDAGASLYRVSVPPANSGPARTNRGHGDEPFVAAVRANIEATRALFATGKPAQVIGTVSGHATAARYWQKHLDQIRAEFGARDAISLHEDLPVNQAFGLLLLWQRIRDRVRPGDGALFAFVFGEGSRATPITEAECGQKPALLSFVRSSASATGYLSMVDLALRYFAPVESYLRRSGFDGLVVKWGDEIQIPTLDLTGADPRLAGADIVRFVSMQAVTDDSAAQKDWVGVDASGRVLSFLPRRPLAEMNTLADRGLLERRDGRLVGGVNLGSIAVSRALLDVLLEEFADDVNAPDADRKSRPDLDPQFFTALTVAAVDDEVERRETWARTVAETDAMAALEQSSPDLLPRLRSAIETFAQTHQRKPNMVALDFGDQYWGDIGQHTVMYDFYMALAEDSPRGQIARALAGIDSPADADGNRIVGNTTLGPGVRVRNSVLINADIADGNIDQCVLIGTAAGTLTGHRAFDVLSRVLSLELGERAGSYRLLSGTPITVAGGERATTVVLADTELPLRVPETASLRDRARNYDSPLPGNPVSFAEAHRAATTADVAAVETRRRELEADIRSRLATATAKSPPHR